MVSGRASADIPGPSVQNGQNRELLTFLAEIAELETGLRGLAEFLDVAAYGESRWHLSARNPDWGESLQTGDGPSARKLFLSTDNQRRYAENPWRDDVDRWSFSGGPFQMMPAAALATIDGAARSMDPMLVFEPAHAIAFITDFVVRLIRNRGARTWESVKVGMGLPAAAKDPNHPEYRRIAEKFTKHARSTGHAGLGARAVPTTAQYPGFGPLLAALQFARVS